MESNTNSSTANSIPAPAMTESSDTGTSMFSDKNSIIIFLLILVIFSFLGINLLVTTGTLLDEIMRIFGPIIRTVLSMFGYSAGHLVNTTSEVASKTAKTGVDIADGALQSVGDLLKEASKDGVNPQYRQNLEKTLDSPKEVGLEKTPEPSSSSNSIHRSISSKKGGWCFIGNDAEQRGCISINEHDKCMSGQIFPTKEACMNPTDSNKPPSEVL